MKEEEEKQRIVKSVVESRKVKSIKEVASTGPGHTNRAQSLNAAPLGDLMPQPQKRNAKKNDKNSHGANEMQRRRNVEELRQRIEQQVYLNTSCSGCRDRKGLKICLLGNYYRLGR